MSDIDLFILAAEQSADALGAGLIKELKKIKPNIKIASVAGPEMRKEKIFTFLPAEKLAAFGFLDIVLSLPRIIKNFLKVKNFILKAKPKAVVLIDFPGFNLKMEKALRKKGYRGKLVHYVSPTVWAWHKSRIKTMEKNLDLLLTIFPFEKQYFASSSLNVKYIGHPLFGNRKSRKPDKAEPILAIFPGSREKVIRRNLPLQLKAALKVLANDPSLKCAISISNEIYRPLIEELSKDFPKEKLLLAENSQNYDLMKRAKAAIATSGTITLELLFHKVPTVVTYAIRPLDLFIARTILKINLPFYCIVNILAGNKELFFEHFGPNFTLEKISASLQHFLNPETSSKCKESCCKVSNLFAGLKPSENAAKAILEILTYSP